MEVELIVRDKKYVKRNGNNFIMEDPPPYLKPYDLTIPEEEVVEVIWKCLISVYDSLFLGV